MLSKQIISKLKESLNESFLEFNLTIKKVNQGISLSKVTDDTAFVAVASFSDYNDFLVFQSLIANIRYDKIEAYLTPILQRERLLGPSTSYREQFTIGSHIEFGFDNSIRNLQVRSLEETSIVIERIQEFIDKKALPFFEDFKSFDHAYQLVLNMPEDQLVQNLGINGVLKKLTILKFASDPIWFHYGESVIAQNQKFLVENPGEPVYERRINALREILHRD